MECADDYRQSRRHVQHRPTARQPSTHSWRRGAIFFDAGGLADPHLTVRKANRPINGLRRLRTGVQMIDSGILTFREAERDAFLEAEPSAAPFS